MVTVIFSGLVPILPFRNNPEFHDLMRMDGGNWPRCLLWHGWLPLLSGVNGCSPWADNAAEGAANLLECALGPYSSGLLAQWRVPDEFDADEAVERVPDAPKVWTDGSLVLDKVSGASSSGSGFFFAHLPGICWVSHWA